MTFKIRFLAATLFILIGLCLSCVKKDNTTEKIKLNIPENFVLEELYAPQNHQQGSWVSITEGPDSTFYTSDQYGSIYHFKIPKEGSKVDPSQVDSVDLNIGFAHGLLWAFNSLYVVVVKSPNEDQPDDPSSGVYRLKDTDNDGKLDFQENILSLSGQGEHGPHTLRVGPDGNSIYLIAGNFNKVPDHFKSRLPKTWEEDNLLPPYLDASGHAVDLKAPGGWVAKSDPDGKTWELIAAGMRNPFGFGFNQYGDLFAYDADMEWDFGMPWYRPTRILHITSGAEFGWRTGSGKWPVYNPDNLPAVENMAQGSPTAVVMGKDLKFPNKYKAGLFACDWSFGTIYYVDLQTKGSSYVGTKEEFLSGTPLPITNAIAGSDGHFYFLTGGRRLSSHLYRLRYNGPQTEKETRTLDPQFRSFKNIRDFLEEKHGNISPYTVQDSWPFLSHEDEFISYAARIAIEHQPLNSWINMLMKEKNETTFIHGALAYARSNGPLDRKIVSKLSSIEWSNQSAKNKLALLRVYNLLLTRQGMPNADLTKTIINRLSPLFPAEDSRINRSLSELLIYLKSPQAVEKCIALLDQESKQSTSSHPEILSEQLLERSEQYGPQIADMAENMPPTEAIFYVTVLSHATEGWTMELRTTYFDWFYKALEKKGGVSYKMFLDNIRANALKKVPQEQYEYFQNISGFYSPLKEMSQLPKPVGPGSNYNRYDLGRIVLWGDDKLNNYDGDIASGKRAFEAALCSSCHRMNGEGSIGGPDLSNLHTRFNKNEIAQSILSPNEEISDQYEFTKFTLKDKSKVVGRIIRETDDSFEVYQSPYNITATTEIDKTNILNKERSSISPMPAKLLNGLNEQEVLDLFVYLLSGADENHEYYK